MRAVGDPDAFMPTDLGVRRAFEANGFDARPRAEAANHARRRAALSAAFPGETLVVPSGVEKARANDTDYPFRPGSDHVWLTGEHDPDAVLVLRPTTDGHDATLFARPRSPRDTD